MIVMRDNFVEFCEKRAEASDNFMLLSADLGFGIFDKYIRQFPSQFLNVGVAEQNLIGIATGLSLVGREVVCYSLGNFPTLRCLEQIRNDAAYHEAAIRIVSSGGGFGYGQLGMSHHATEDVGILKALPNVEIFAPATVSELEYIFATASLEAAVQYIRLEKAGPAIKFKNLNPEQEGRFVYREGSDLLFLCLGTTIEEGLNSAKLLEGYDYDASVCTLYGQKHKKGFSEDLLEYLNRFQYLVTVEEHNLYCGIASVLFDNFGSNLKPEVIRFGLPDCYTSVVGDQPFLRSHYGLDAQSIVDTITAMIKK